jgi:hypothetical protein
LANSAVANSSAGIVSIPSSSDPTGTESWIVFFSGSPSAIFPKLTQLHINFINIHIPCSTCHREVFALIKSGKRDTASGAIPVATLGYGGVGAGGSAPKYPTWLNP